MIKERKQAKLNIYNQIQLLQAMRDGYKPWSFTIIIKFNVQMYVKYYELLYVRTEVVPAGDTPDDQVNQPSTLFCSVRF